MLKGSVLLMFVPIRLSYMTSATRQLNYDFHCVASVERAYFHLLFVPRLNLMFMLKGGCSRRDEC
jgi:hypothetical protein